METYSVHPEMR